MKIPTKQTIFEHKLQSGAVAVKVPMLLQVEWPVAAWDIENCNLKDCPSSFHTPAFGGKHYVPFPTVTLFGKGLHKLDEQDHGFEIEEILFKVI